MAMRPVFMSGFKGNLCRPTTTEFTFFNGLSAAQRRRSAVSLGEAFMREHPDRKVLEISSFSDKELGVALSAFNLMLTLENGNKVTVECAYQAGKIFEHGGPYTDLLLGPSINAKKDSRLKNSGKIIGFSFEGKEFPARPVTNFYNWLYIRALTQNPELADGLMEYDSFTDIVFNPQKMISCQAEAAAYYVALRKSGLLEESLKSPEDFVRIVYKQDFDSGLMKKVFGVENVKAGSSGGVSGLNGSSFSGKSNASGASLAHQEAAAPSEPEKPFESTFKVGDKIEHPKFGVGEIVKVEVHESSARLTIAFAQETKTLDEKWIAAKCKRVE